MEPNAKNIGFDKLVTPYQQQFGRKENSCLSLKTICKDTAILQRFPPYEFPDFDLTTDGNVFIQPMKHIIQTLEDYYIKWIPGKYTENEGFLPSHDHAYPYVPVTEDQWLMKVVIQRLDLQAGMNTFEVQYLTQISKIQTILCQNKDGDPMERVTPFKLENFPSLQEQLTNPENQTKFFQKYLSDVYSMDDEARDHREW